MMQTAIHTNGRIDVGRAVRVADALLRPLALAFAAVRAEDPLRLDLPALPGAGADLAPRTLRLMAALYLQAELEFAGIIPVAELLAEHRARHPYGPEAAGLLEDYHLRMREWYRPRDRGAVFARTFGLDPHGNGDGSSNLEFQSLFSHLCLALSRHGEAAALFGRPSLRGETGIRLAGRNLLDNLSRRQYGNTVLAAARIQEQLRHSLDLLGHPEVQRIHQGRGMWDTLRRIWGSDAPDMGRHAGRGQSGMALLAWLSDRLDAFRTQPDRPLDAAGLAEGTRLASTWLAACGLAEEAAA